MARRKEPGGGRAVSRAYLVPDGAFDGTVHSVFDTACNLAVSGGLITVHDADSGHTPTSIRVVPGSGTRWSPSARPGDRVRCRKGFLAVGADVLDLRHLPVWSPRPPETPAAPSALGILLGELDDACTQHGELGVLAGELHRALATAPCGLDRVVDKLIGFGPGLTPSGDDMLVGLMATLQWVGTAPAALAALRQSVAQRVHRTSDVSVHYLRLATEGHFGEPINELLKALLDGASREAVVQRIGQVLSVGASSGADALLGARIGFRTHLTHSHRKAA